MIPINDGSAHSRFRTIRYLGNKRKLSTAICEAIEGVANAGNHVIDLFAGSCSISYEMKRTHPVLSNDNQRYSYHLAKAIIENESDRIIFESLSRSTEFYGSTIRYD